MEIFPDVNNVCPLPTVEPSTLIANTVTPNTVTPDTVTPNTKASNVSPVKVDIPGTVDINNINQPIGQGSLVGTDNQEIILKVPKLLLFGKSVFNLLLFFIFLTISFFFRNRK